MTLRSQGASVFIHLSPTVKPAKTKRTTFSAQQNFGQKQTAEQWGANVINKASQQSVTNNDIRQKVFQISNLLYVLWNSNTYVQKIVVPLHTYYIYNNEIEINNNYFNRLPVHNG